MRPELTEEQFAKISNMTAKIMTAIKEEFPDSMTTDPVSGGIVSNQLTLVLAIAFGTQAKHFSGNEATLADLIDKVVVGKLKQHAIDMFRDLDPNSPHNLAYHLMPISDNATQEDIKKFLDLVDSLTKQKGKPN